MKTITGNAKVEEFDSKLRSLTDKEHEAMKQIWISSSGNGHDFGYADDVHVAGAKKHGTGGVLSSLIKKGMIEWDSQFGQIAFIGFTEDRYDAARKVQEFYSLS